MRMKFQHLEKCIKDKNSGFTLVEIAVTLVLSTVLCTIAVAGIIRWQDHADFRKQNEYAREIFAAAQSRLTQYGERGQLTALKIEITDDGSAEAEDYRLKAATAQVSLWGASGDLIDLDSIWQKDNHGVAPTGDIYYLKAEKGDYTYYDRCLKNTYPTTAADRRLKVLFDLLDPYVANKSTLDAAICIEVDPDPKVVQVYSVFYGDKVEGFVYSEPGSGSSKVSINDRREEVRKKDKIGYYGADMMAKTADTSIPRPVLGNVHLHNEDTLNLTWTADSVEALYQLIYSINIYRASEGGDSEEALIGSLTLGTVDEGSLSTDSAGLVKGMLELMVSEAGKNRSWHQQEIELPAIISRSDRQITLVLDGLDLAADEINGAEDTTSIKRMGLTADNIYVSIAGSRSGMYALTLPKKSNTEHQYLGKMQVTTEKGIKTRTFRIENFRHLSNIRYYEADYGASGAKQVYKVTADMDWEVMLDSGKIWRNLIPITASGKTEKDHFRPILCLGTNSALLTDGGEKAHVLRNLTLTTADVPVIDETVAAEEVGLFVENRGQISNLMLADLQVIGQAEGTTGASGGFCARSTDTGSLNNLTIQSGRISGGVNVGAIAGIITGSGAYQKLDNYAEVSGKARVGGIAGNIMAESNELQVTECINYGKVQETIGSAVGFIGGIAGYAAAQPDSGGNLTLELCSSAPPYTADEIKKLTANPHMWPKGSYIGGIIGFGQDVQIKECGTFQNPAANPGYVVGADYVGGIVGFYKSTGEDNRLTGGSKNNRNQSNVIGNKYVGGITGMNMADSNEEQMVIKDWINEGVVIATQAYSGGISGYNTGIIRNCSSNVAYPGEEMKLSSLGENARFVGGIAGRNQGTVESGTARVLAMVSNISGGDYVGGIVGFNDPGAKVSGYKAGGGYVRGRRFVGGYIGLNASAKVFDGTNIFAGSDEVTGDYFVGGVIGGNLVAMADGEELNVNIENHNSSGVIAAEQGAFAGGIIGYNYLLKSAATGEIILTAADILCENQALQPIKVMQAKEQDQALRMVEEPLATWLSPYANETARIKITGEDNGDSSPRTKPGSIKAMAYVGGVVGYNRQTTRLEIGYVENITPVTATAYLTGLEHDAGEKRYSYAGGIIGKVGENVTIRACKNKEGGRVQTQGTYTGGLAEVNDGLIVNCVANNLGDETLDYVGGLVGVNFAAADEKGIIDCKAEGAIIGRSYVGGLTAENFGRIENPVLEHCVITASGNHVGGVTGYGYGGSTIILDAAHELNVTISGTASYVGGIAGSNDGLVRKNAENSSAKIKNSKDSQIAGERYVGGFIGVQMENAGTLEDFENHAQILAEQDCAGGITAINYGTIHYCSNYAQIQSGAGSVGGITALNYGMISSTLVTGADNGRLEITGHTYVGGVAAINGQGGIIKDAAVIGLELENHTTSGGGGIGGIAGLNENRISSCAVGVAEGEEYYDQHREATISLLKGVKSANGLYDNLVIVTSYAADISLGGVTGINTGTIAGRTDENQYTAVTAELKFANDNRTYYGYIGGIAGTNKGTIKKYEFNGFVHGTANNPVKTPGDSSEYDFDTEAVPIYGYGGIAGINGKVKGAGDAIIQDCLINAAKIYGGGTANNYVNLGGIAGVNGRNGQILRIRFSQTLDSHGFKIQYQRFGIKTEDYSRENMTAQGLVLVSAGEGYGNVGGITGLNLGSIRDINDWSDYAGHRENYVVSNAGSVLAHVDDTAVIVHTYMGHIGGIVGLNHRTGSVDYVVTGKNWLVLADKAGRESATGGIIGLNISENDTRYCDNHSTVVTMEGSCVAGVAGRIEASAKSSWRFYSCRNYGFINGRVKTAGIVGQWKFKGGTLEQCKNYGRIQSQAGPIAGIVGMLSQLESHATINLISCENHGDIGNSSKRFTYPVGGIAGSVDSSCSDGRRVNMYQCVNTGLLGGAEGYQSAGMILSPASADLNLSYCRNYGYPMVNKGEFSGMVSAQNIEYAERTTLYECFGITDSAIGGHVLCAGITNLKSRESYYFESPEQTGNSPAGGGIPLYVKQLGSKYIAANQQGQVLISDLGSNSLADITRVGEGDMRFKDSANAYLLYQKLDSCLTLSTTESIGTWALQLDETRIKTDIREICRYRVMENGIAGGRQAEAVQRGIAFDGVEEAAGYHLIIIQQPRMLAGDWMVKEISELKAEVVEGAAGRYRITWDSTADTKLKTRFTKELQVGDAVDLPYRKTIEVTGSITGDISDDINNDIICIEATARLRADINGETGKIQFILTLPDFEELINPDDAGEAQAGQGFTEQIMIRAMSGDDSDLAVSEISRQYQDAGWVRIVQEGAEGFEQRKNILPVENPLDPGALPVTVVESKYPGVAFESDAFEEKHQYLVSVAYGKEDLGIYAVPFQKISARSGGEDIYSQSIWLPEEFAEYAGKTLTVRFRNVIALPAGQGGLTGGFGRPYDLHLPLTTRADSVLLTQIVSAEQNYQVTVPDSSKGLATASDAAAAGTAAKLTIRQEGVIWFYDLAADSKVAGYELEIQGINMESGYKLKLDLTRNSFGQFPGLKEYVTEDGKILYTVLYYLDGKVIGPDGVRQKTVGTSSATASNSNASVADEEMGRLKMKAILKAEYVTEDEEITAICFTLLLPDGFPGRLKGKEALQDQDVYEEGLHHTEAIRVSPVMVNRYYKAPEQEWFYLEKGQMLEDDINMEMRR